jgi:integrase
LRRHHDTPLEVEANILKQEGSAFMGEVSKRSGESWPGSSSPVLVYLSGVEEKGRPKMWGSLNAVAQRLGYSNARAAPWDELQAEHVAALRTWLSGALKPARVNRYLSAIKGTMKVAWQLGQIDGGRLVKILGVKAVRGGSRSSGRSLSAHEIHALVDACADGTFKGKRDLAVIALAYRGGLRRAEIAALNVEDVKAEAGAFVVRVPGRGREFLVSIDNGGAEAIRDFLTGRGEAPGPLFWKDGENKPRERLTADGLFGVLRERAHTAGVEGVSPHDMRHTFVSDMLAASADVLTVSALTGHGNPKATVMSGHVGAGAKRKTTRYPSLPLRASRATP